MIQKKVTLVIGATSMIGQACAHLFTQQGMKLMLVARNQQKLTKLANELNGDIEFCAADISNEDNINCVIDKTIKTFHRIDAVIHNVAIYPWKCIAE